MKNESANKIGIFDKWVSPGPKAEGWLQTTSPMAFLVGPIGGCKTTTGSMKCIDVAKRQHRSVVDGFRKAKILALRPNYRRMHQTLIPSVQKFFGKRAKWTGENDGPCTMKARFDFRDRPEIGKVYLEILFQCYGDEDLESFVRGFEPTSIWLNEVDENPPDCLGLFMQRTGQRAFMDELPENPPQIDYSELFGDLNMPDEDSWFTEDIIENTPDGCELFIQPSGFSPDAENMHNLSKERPDYYQHKAKQMKPWQVRRFIENKVGLSRAGEPVYDDYSDELHLNEENVSPISGIPLGIGVDQGLTPAAIISQKADARRVVLAEVVTPEGTAVGAKEFGRSVGAQVLKLFPTHAAQGLIKVSLDPAAKQRDSDMRNFIINFVAGLSEKLPRFDYKVARTNDVNSRIEAVASWHRKNVGGRPAFSINPRCRWLRRAYVSGYRLNRKKVNGAIHFQDKPDKNEYSHVADADQYDALADDHIMGSTEVASATSSPVIHAQGRQSSVRSVNVRF